MPKPAPLTPAAPAPGPEAGGFSFALEEHGDRVELRALHRRRYGAISADWTGAEQQRRIAGGRRQPLARAVGLHRDPTLSVLDATAGLGRDGYTLAALGASVSMAERHASVVELLRDAQRRALLAPPHASAAQRIEIMHADVHDLLDGRRRWDVVFLDPMYPEDGKTALPSKEMQILRELAGADEDADRLLAPAFHCARMRVVVKRPSKAPYLAGEAPSLSLAATQVRFDVYLKSAIRVA